MDFLNTLVQILKDLAITSGFASGDWKNYVMIGLSLVLIYLAIAKKFEPLLLLPIAFGMLLSNLPGAGLYTAAYFEGGHINWAAIGSGEAGLLDILYIGVKLGIYPCIIFVGIGAMTDFSSLIANPKALLMGAGAQLGIFVAFAGALLLGQIPGIDFTMNDAASIGIIGGADGPTAIFVTRLLSPELLGPIAIAAYSYMALIPAIQKPIMRALTTKKERAIKMSVLRPVSQTEKIVFPIMVTILIALFLPSAAPLIGCLMFGNLIKESGVCDRLVKTASNELMNIVTIFLGLSVGATATAANFLTLKTLGIVGMGVVAFALGTVGGLLVGKLMCVLTGGKINPLIGSAGVSAVPMAARVSQAVGAEEDPTNFLLMHAMGPNVAGVIGSAVAAGVFIAVLG